MEQKEFIRRRKRLMDMMAENSIAIVPTATVKIRNRDIAYPFRADSDFYYLTGFTEPEAVAVFVPDRPHAEYLLFCQEKDPDKERWHGLRVGLEDACTVYGADDAFPISDMDEIIPGLLENKERIFYTMGNDTEFDQRILKWVNQVRGRARIGVTAPEEFIALRHILHELRLYKSRQEIKSMRYAAKVSAAAHCRAMQYCRPGLMEYQMEAELMHEFYQSDCKSPAYPSIVGAGRNACILHYTENNAELMDGDLLLIDAGAEYGSYASDITRTFPINGRFSPEQRAIYELVLEAQLAAIEKVKPGNHWNDPHQATLRVLTKGLVRLGILKGKVNKLIKDEAYKPFYMHRSGHWLGMDVHDVADYKVDGEWRLLEPGMALTVEPGLYLDQDIKGLAKKWWNIGVRIEDDVLVTRSGHDVLSSAAPKKVDDIESLMQQGHSR